uniref:Putative secreted protein n=1 Tax=Ixodes ricinus TaxID=34613 RepID=A0A0K8R6I2_IXORI
MVCIPCIIAPVLLYIWYRFIQPIVLKFWNPWEKKEIRLDAAGDARQDSTKLASDGPADATTQHQQEASTEDKKTN